MIDYNHAIVGQQIKKYREANNLTQRELADLIGVSSSYIGNLETGGRTKNSSISMKNICKISEVLGVTPDDLASINLECKIKSNKNPIINEIERELDGLSEKGLELFKDTIPIFSRKKK